MALKMMRRALMRVGVTNLMNGLAYTHLKFKKYFQKLKEISMMMGWRTWMKIWMT
jgi:hypothetical protein